MGILASGMSLFFFFSDLAFVPVRFDGLMLMVFDLVCFFLA